MLAKRPRCAPAPPAPARPRPILRPWSPARRRRPVRADLSGVPAGARCSRPGRRGAPARRDARRSGSGRPDLHGVDPPTLDPGRRGRRPAAPPSSPRLFEGLTAIDATLTPRPALAERWELRDDGLTVVFTLRDGLAFSDGTPLTAADVRRSWLRVLDPARAVAARVAPVRRRRRARLRPGHRSGRAVGITRRRPDLRGPPDARRPATSPTIAASPVARRGAPGASAGPAPLAPGQRLRRVRRLPDRGHGHRRAHAPGQPALLGGPPAISSVTLVSDIGGTQPGRRLLCGPARLDARGASTTRPGWPTTRTLGPSLRSLGRPGGHLLRLRDPPASPSTTPASDARSRRRSTGPRIVAARGRRRGAAGHVHGSAGDPRPQPTGDSCRRSTRPARAAPPRRGGLRRTRADVPRRHPGRRRAPATTRRSWPSSRPTWASRCATKRSTSRRSSSRLGSPDSPDMWALSWIADYPSPNDFLGILLGAGQPNNYGGWSSGAPSTPRSRTPSGASDAAAARAGYDAAEAIVADRGAGDPGDLRDRLRAGPRRAPRGHHERPGDPPARRARVGGAVRRGLARGRALASP